MNFLNQVVLVAEEGAAKKAPEFHVPSVTELFEWVPLAEFQLFGITFHFSSLIIFLFGSVFLTSALFYAGFRKPTIIPGKLQNFLESALGFVRESIVLPTIGPEGERFLPFLSSLFFFVFTLNLMEIIPGVQYPISSRMAFPTLLALLSYFVFNYVGIRAQGFIPYFKGVMFPPGVPKPIYIILAPVEFFSTLIFRPLTLALRLFANMMAGHVMLAIFFVASGFFLIHGEGMLLRVMAPIPILMSVVLVGFELFIGAIQAFIFTILTSVYIAGALHAEH